MAAAPKKRAFAGDMKGKGGPREDGDGQEDDSEEDMYSGSEESEGSDMDVAQEVQVDFEARTACDSDFHGIKRLLGQLFLKSHVNLSELTDIILSQNYIGCVIKQDEVPEDSDSDDGEEEIFGFITIVNITDRKDKPCLQALKELVLERCKECAPKNTYEELTNILENDRHRVGFLMCERFINLPPQLALPMYESLNKDLQQAQIMEMQYAFDYILLISKTYTEVKTEGGKKGKKSSQPQEQREEVLFTNAEEEFFHQEAHTSFSYPVIEESDSGFSGKWKFGDTATKPFRTVMLVPNSKMVEIKKKMEEYLSV
ncbi:BRCA2 and CDKN1A-interacting protein-like [Branchiostoma lanceolatum]|uniref:BRCA2 and CDKN1A-interacting protein-like n=1 Tax=Branchiostoma lanceolatum TaxID=7740 RepID=UPI0034562B80